MSDGLAKEHIADTLYFNGELQRKEGREKDALEYYQRAVKQAEAADDPQWVFHAASRIGFIMRDRGELPEALASLKQSFNAGINRDTGDVIATLKGSRADAVLVGIHRTKLLTSAGLLTEAFQSQADSCRLVNQWVEAELGAPYDCLTDTPPRNLANKTLSYVWRMRTSQSTLWDLTARSVDAARLLERTLAESAGAKAGSQADREWQRTRTSLAVILSFLGHRNRALELYREMAKDRPGTLNAGYANFNAARLASRLEGPSVQRLEEAKKARALVLKLGGKSSIAGLDRILAKMRSDLGQAEEAKTKLLALEKEAAGRGDEMLQLYVRRQLLFTSDGDSTGKSSDTAYETMLASYRDRGVRRGVPFVYREYAFYLARSKRHGEALSMMREAARLTEQYGWYLHLPRLLIVQASWHQKQGQEKEAQALWARIDELIREHDDFPESRLLEIALARVEWLASRDQLDEARAAYRVASNLVKRAKLTEIQKKGFRALDLKTLLKKPEATAEEAPLQGWADLQPLAVRAVPIPGRPSTSAFVLSNPSSVGVSGTLHARGPITGQVWNEETARWKLTLTSTSAVTRTKAENVTCAPGESILVIIRTDDAVLESGVVDLVWRPKNKSTQGNLRSRWELGEAVTEAQAVEATLASSTKRNAFYAVPVPQRLQATSDKPVTQDYRIRASSPCWIEITTLAGEPIAIDANGNGEFQNVGDHLETDTNANGVPEMFLDPNKGSAETILFNVYPNEDSDRTKPIELHFQIRNESGEWETVSVSEVF